MALVCVKKVGRRGTARCHVLREAGASTVTGAVSVPTARPAAPSPGNAPVHLGGTERSVSCPARLEIMVLDVARDVNVKTLMAVTPSPEHASVYQDGQGSIVKRPVKKDTGGEAVICLVLVKMGHPAPQKTDRAPAQLDSRGATARTAAPLDVMGRNAPSIVDVPTTPHVTPSMAPVNVLLAGKAMTALSPALQVFGGRIVPVPVIVNMEDTAVLWMGDVTAYQAGLGRPALKLVL